MTLFSIAVGIVATGFVSTFFAVGVTISIARCQVILSADGYVTVTCVAEYRMMYASADGYVTVACVAEYRIMYASADCYDTTACATEYRTFADVIRAIAATIAVIFLTNTTGDEVISQYDYTGAH